MNEVVVLIPLYRPTLTPDERISLRRTCQVLGGYPLVVVHPEGLCTGQISREFPSLAFERFADHYFRDIIGYNRLMLSEEFYGRFQGRYEYLLICQTDCYIFHDALSAWCRRGYDYVGAPYLRRPVYSWPVVRQLVALRQAWMHARGRRTQFDRYLRVGNGGLSLRRVESHLRFLRENPGLVARYTRPEHRVHLGNEDTFWAMEPTDFRYPTWQEAMLFAYNKYPELSYRLTGGQTPFGCHGWTKPRYRRFWQQGPQALRIPQD